LKHACRQFNSQLFHRQHWHLRIFMVEVAEQRALGHAGGEADTHEKLSNREFEIFRLLTLGVSVVEMVSRLALPSRLRVRRASHAQDEPKNAADLVRYGPQARLTDELDADFPRIVGFLLGRGIEIATKLCILNLDVSCTISRGITEWSCRIRSWGQGPVKSLCAQKYQVRPGTD
jgi:hypothetical protein